MTQRNALAKTGPVISVIGAGYVGLTTATLFSNVGYKVYLIEPFEEKVKIIKTGKSHFFEPNLDELVKNSIDSGLMIATTDYNVAIPNSSVVFCCMGTPDKPDGSSNLQYVFEALEKSAKLAKDGTIFVQKSTVPVGTGARLIKHIKKAAPDLKFDYVSNPEFLREGTAISDSLYPDRTVIGGASREALQQIARIYTDLEKAAPEIDPVFQKEFQRNERPKGDIVITSLESAELIKVTANAFLALKISFSNTIAKLCDAVGADVNEVMDGVGKDRRIGRAFLNAGRGYGGGCFPKDVSGLIAAASERNVDMEIMAGATNVNNSMPYHIIDKIQHRLGNLSGKKVAVLGLSFKAGTSDTRRSPGVQIARLLYDGGAKVIAHDPKAILEHNELNGDIERANSMKEAVSEVEVVVLATDWPEYVSYRWEDLPKHSSAKVVVDCMNSLNAEDVLGAGLKFIGVGRF